MKIPSYQRIISSHKLPTCGPTISRAPNMCPWRDHDPSEKSATWQLDLQAQPPRHHPGVASSKHHFYAGLLEALHVLCTLLKEHLEDAPTAATPRPSGTVTAVVALMCFSFCFMLEIMVLGWQQTPNQHGMCRGEKACIFSCLCDNGEMQALPLIISFIFPPTGSPKCLCLIGCWPFCDCRLWRVVG